MDPSLAYTCGNLNAVSSLTAPSLVASTSCTLANASLSGTVRHANEGAATVATSKSLAYVDSGLVQRVGVDALTVTLPTAANAGHACFIIENNGASDGAVGITIALQTNTDTIKGAGITASAGKALINTKATAKRGDRVAFISDGTDSYIVQHIRGTFNRQA